MALSRLILLLSFPWLLAFPAGNSSVNSHYFRLYILCPEASLLKDSSRGISHCLCYFWKEFWYLWSRIFGQSSFCW